MTLPANRILLLVLAVGLLPALTRAQDLEAPPPSLEELNKEIERQRRDLQAHQAALDSLMEESAGSEPVLRVYGFVDAGLQKVWVPRDSVLPHFAPTLANTFVVGNLNLYLDAQPHERWSALVEVRLSNYPDGEVIAAAAGVPLKLTSTGTFDYTNPGGGYNRLTLGGLVIERAYVQYRHNDLLGVRIGAFLTPFGIWNVDHGTPTLIALALPQLEILELFPTHQIGVEVLGSLRLAAWELGYTAYVSNGRSSTQVDLTDDKAFGGRLYARTTRPHALTFGASAYAGRYSDRRQTYDVADPTTFVSSESVAYRERALGLDASVDLGPLRLRGELAFHMVRYERGKRELLWGIPGLYQPDRNDLDLYLLASYQLPWGLEPYLYAEIVHVPTPYGDGGALGSAGLNIHFNAAAQLKLQFTHEIGMEEIDHLRIGRAHPLNFDSFAIRQVLAF